MARRTEQWQFAGRRLGAKSNKILHAFVDGDGEQHAFPATVGGSVIGWTYDIDVERDGDNMTVFGKAVAAADQGGVRDLSEADAARLAAWRAEDRDARLRRDVELAEKAAARDQLDLSELTLAEARRWVQAPSSRSLQAARLALVIKELT
jgi:hypothetical protein